MDPTLTQKEMETILKEAPSNKENRRGSFGPEPKLMTMEFVRFNGVFSDNVRLDMFNEIVNHDGLLFTYFHELEGSAKNSFFFIPDNYYEDGDFCLHTRLGIYSENDIGTDLCLETDEGVFYFTTAHGKMEEYIKTNMLGLMGDYLGTNGDRIVDKSRIERLWEWPTGSLGKLI